MRKSIRILELNKFRFILAKEFVENGGSLMVMLGEGGEVEFNTNLNFLLEEYGMSINNGKS